MSYYFLLFLFSILIRIQIYKNAYINTYKNSYKIHIQRIQNAYKDTNQLIRIQQIHNSNVRTEDNKTAQFNISGMAFQEKHYIRMCHQQ